MDPMAEIKASFFVECAELLEGLEEGLLLLQDGSNDPETVNAVFRAVHSIKGGAGAFGLDALVHFAHRFETVLDAARSGTLILDGETVLLFLRAADLLADHVSAARDGTPDKAPQSDETLLALEALLGGEGTKDAADAEDVDFTPAMLSLDLPSLEKEPSHEGTRFRFIPEEGLNASGNEPLFLLRALSNLGDFQLTLERDRLPDLNALDPGKTYLSWHIQSDARIPQDDIEDIFDFATGLCTLDFDATPPPAAAPPAPLITPTQDIDDPAPIDAAIAKTTAPKPTTPSATVRVDLDRIDRLVNLVGELVINQAMLAQSLSEVGLTATSAVAAGLEEFQQLTRDIQDSVMAIRAQSVKPLFQRMSRIVREAAAETGKKVHLQIEGEATEIDKTVIERLADPLTHMIRNAVDHGLEMAEERAACGKPEDGTIILRAAHKSGRVAIDIADDGAGINRARVRAIAEAKGLIEPEVHLSESEIDNLLFLPGFSTASEISNLSGRGVGMDVVKRAIQALGGRISITSTPGAGSTFSISLPLTLAILDGMVVESCGQTMVVPLASIVETLTLAETQIHALEDGSRVIHLRGSFVPILDLGTAFGYRGAASIPADAVVLFILSEDEQRYALIVDTIQEQRQVVIKGLSETYGYVPGVAAATILGDGKIALILDTADLIAQANAPFPLSRAG